MPNIFTVSGYKVYFWSNENDEPLHVHISKGKPIPNATKLWITKDGRCVLENNNSKIPEHELAELMEFIEAQYWLILIAWTEHFAVKEADVRYYI